MRARPRFLLLAIVTLVSCASLDPLQGGVCGNGVVEGAEDCDSHDLDGFTCGAAGSAHACQITCDGSGNHPCPDGWGCAVDGVCRQPSGSFPAAADPQSSGVNGIHIGDFDGDGRKDILGTGLRSADNTARARVLYFGDNATLEHTTLLTAPLASPTVRNFDLDSDNTDDFAFGALDIGFGVMTGRKDRTLVPLLFPSFTRPAAEVLPVIIRGTRRQVPDSQLDVSIDPSQTTALLYVGQVDTANTWKLTSLGSDPNKSYDRALSGVTSGLFGDPVWADLFPSLKDVATGGDATTCGEVIVAFATSGGAEIDVYSPCKPLTAGRAEWASDKPPTQVITTTKPLIGGVHVADVNGDGHLDLIYATEAMQATVAYGDGKTLAAGTPSDVLGEVPLASGDINGDGVIDFVTPSSVVLSQPSIVPSTKTYARVTSPRRTRWTAARFGNVTTQSTPEAGLLPLGDAGVSQGPAKISFLVAASSDQPDIDYFQNVPGAAFPTPSTIPTNGPVVLLEVGDFDGDTQDDVAFVETNSATGQQDLVYAYGRGIGPPDPPATVGSLSGAVGLVPELSSTAAVPLAVFTVQPVAGSLGTVGAAVVIGSGDRQPLAPLILSDEFASAPLNAMSAQSRRWAPLSVMAGSLIDPSHVDLTAISVGYTYDALGALEKPPYPVGPWIAQGTGVAGSFGVAKQVGDLTIGPTAGIEFIDPKTLDYTPTIIADDIDKPKNGVIEILALARTHTAEPQLVVVRVPPAPMTPPVVTLTSLAADGVGLPNPALRVLDVDGDGGDDLVAMLGATTATHAGGTKLVVYLNEGGTFHAPPGIPIPIPAAPPSLTDIGPVAVTMITIGAAPPSSTGTHTRALAIATQKRVFLATLKADKSGFDVSELALFGAAGLRGATGIGAGDFDGDGVEDLAIADAGSVRIVLQQSTQTLRVGK
ncbi:MAG TPA: VCBS repeat-containing protein [Labilithrix sp.]|jgi:hypothetical protein